MKKEKERKVLSCLVYGVLVMAVAVVITGCSQKNAETTTNETKNEVTEKSVLGQGKTQFEFSVVDQDGNVKEFEIHTDQEIVGKALLEVGLIEGEESEYGLFVKTVNGITVDFETDGLYWAFYVNDEYAQVGVDSTMITASDVYSFRIE